MSGLQELSLKKEKIKTLKVLGEDVAQIVLEGHIPIRAIKIVKIHTELRQVETEVFENKVVLQGVIHKQVFYVDPENFVRHTTEDLPFMTHVDIKGICPSPFIEVQVHLLNIDTNYHLDPAECRDDEVGHGKFATLRQKVVAHILVKVSEWTQLDVITHIDVFPRNSASCRVIRSC